MSNQATATTPVECEEHTVRATDHDESGFSLYGTIISIVLGLGIIALTINQFATAESGMDISVSTQNIARAMGAIKTFNRVRNEWPDTASVDDLKAIRAYGADTFFGVAAGGKNTKGNVFGLDIDLKPNGEFDYDFGNTTPGKDNCTLVVNDLKKSQMIGGTSSCTDGKLTVKQS